jgi:hypothetical protein
LFENNKTTRFQLGFLKIRDPGIGREKSRDPEIPIGIEIQGNFAVTDLKTKSEKHEISNENFQLSRKHAVFIRIKFLNKVFQILETKKLSNGF